MKVEFIDLPFLLNAQSLDGLCRKRTYPIILIDHRFEDPVFVMVKSLRSILNNKYEVTT